MSVETLEHQGDHITKPEKARVHELSPAEKLLQAIEAGKDPDSDIVDLLNYSTERSKEDRIIADEVGGLAIVDRVAERDGVPLKLGEQPIDELARAFESIAEERGEESLYIVVDKIEKAEQEQVSKEGTAEVSSGISEFDRLPTYSPEFPGQNLLHRSNAELKEGDIVLPSNQISAEMHRELNGARIFNSTSSPRGAASGENEFYDAKLAHAGTRDYGEVYGKYLYEVEALEDDTPKWGENFGASNRGPSVNKHSPAFNLEGRDGAAVTDSYYGKDASEVVSARGFRVVRELPHEPIYNEAILPWPVTPDDVQKHKDRYESDWANIPNADGHNVRVQVRRTSRKKPGKIGPVDTPGTYRAGDSDRVIADWQNHFAAQKRQIEKNYDPVKAQQEADKIAAQQALWQSWQDDPSRPYM